VHHLQKMVYQANREDLLQPGLPAKTRGEDEATEGESIIAGRANFASRIHVA
jgi:hypothetical protein